MASQAPIPLPYLYGIPCSSWHDVTDGGNYTLDRQSGDLTVALSTGGYFLHERCGLEN
jgi:hypothetical protein